MKLNFAKLMIKTLLFLTLFFGSKILFSQDSKLQDYTDAMSSFVLIKDSLDQIPLVSFKQNKIGVIASKGLHSKVFIEKLENYIPVDERIFSSEFSKQLANDWMSSKEKVFIFLSSEEKDLQYYIKELCQSKSKFLSKIILIVEDDSEFMNYSNSSEIPVVFYLQYKNDWSISLLAQSIMGAGSMLDLKTAEQNDFNLRLGFAPPEYVGMDSEFLHSKIDSIVRFGINEKAFPGAQVLIAKNNKIVFHKAYGFHTYEKKQEVQLNDIYDFASVSKITTALPALMKLHGEGKFDLEKPLKTYFPKFKRSNKKDLTWREILAHQSGLKPWIPYWKNTVKKNGKFKWRTFKKKPNRNYNIKITDHLFLHKKYKKKMYKAICKSPVSEEKKYKYSGLAFYLFPEIVAKLANDDYETYLKKTFYEPIGATTLTYNPSRFFDKSRIVPTERDTFFRQVQIHGTVHDEGAIMMGGVSANAGLFGSAEDLAKLMQMYLNEGTYGGQKFIAAESIREFTKYQYPENDNRRGLGFDKPLLEYDFAKSSVAKDASPSSYGHSGYTGTFVWVDPEHELIYIFFSNRVFPTRDNRKIYQLNLRPDIHQIIYDSFKNK